MTGKVLCLLLLALASTALVQGYHAPPMSPPMRPPQDLIQDLVERVKDLIEEAQVKVPEMEHIIQNGGQELKEPANVANEGVLNLAESAVSKAGECGKTAEPQLEEAKKDVEIAIEKCINIATTKGSEVIEKVKLLLVIAEKLVKNIEAEIEECNAAASPADLTSCLANIVTSQDIKLDDLTSQVVPNVFTIYKLTEDVQLCVNYQTQKLKRRVNKIVDTVESCSETTK